MASSSRLSVASSSGPKLRSVLPLVWDLVRPRRSLLALGFVLMAINRIASLVLPYSTRFLIDNVMVKRHTQLLKPIIFAVLLATVIQGITSFSLTQLLSKAAQRLIAELRQKVQAHVGRLSVSFHDSTKSGVLVSRIMSDVEGVRNLIGTGLVDLVGGVLTASIALVVLFRISSMMTILAFGFLLCFALALKKAFETIRPIFRERGKINAEVTGRLAESLGGIRVVKGYHAETREEKVFSVGVLRLLENVMRTLTATSVMGLSANLLLGVVGAVIMFVGTQQILAGSLTIGEFFTYTLFMGFLIAPVMQIVQIGTQLTEALAGLERTQEILKQPAEDRNPSRTIALPEMRGDIEFQNVSFSYDGSRTVLEDVSFQLPLER
jgi:ABC-type bacteriocin/lantibiotic exporter with double-glycine peptidase domain